MAREQITTYTDDLTGGPATTDRSFEWMGSRYRIDLNDKNAADVDKFMQRLTENAERIGAASGVARAGTGRTANRKPVSASALVAQKEERATIRQWLTDNGFEPKLRGAIPAHHVTAFYKAHPTRRRIV